MDHGKALPLASLLFFLLACSGAGDQGSAAVAGAAEGFERVVKEVTIHSGSPVTMADLSIEGMSCEMMCGGSIKKALAKLPGVTATEIMFSEAEQRDHAIVTYNEAEVTDAQMIEAVHALHGGQYKVMAVTITKQVRGSGASVEGGEGGSGEVSVYSPGSVVLPSVLSLLSLILRR
jgi:copper chaperone CopZ